MKPPPRMHEDPTLRPELCRDVERAIAEPEEYDVTAGEARLAAALTLGMPQAAAEDVPLTDGGAASGLPASGSPAWIGSLGAKLGIAAATVTAIAVAIAVWSERPAPHARPSSAPPPVARPTAVTTQPAAGATPPIAAPSAPEVPKQAPDLRAQSRPSQPAAIDADAELRREIAQVARIKALLEGEPAQAYQLAQAGHREFVRGMLREEREALALLALWSLDRRSEALRRSRAFLARYPRSAHREQIERRLQSEQGRDANAP